MRVLSAILLTLSLVAMGCTVETVLPPDKCDPSKKPGESGACEAPSALCGAGTELKDGKCVPKAPDDDAGGTDAGGADAGGADGGATDAGGTDAGADTGTCTPQCDGRECGDNGCGGSCGDCPSDKKHCGADGKCSATCTPSCAGKQCGDDGCGGSCGDCGDGTCSAVGVCVPKAWTCQPAAYAADGVCDCGCGTPDPECATPGLSVQGCKAGEVCKQGACAPGIPSGWTCAPSWYQDGGFCDCECGVADPDCKDPKLPTPACGLATCTPDGTCGACKPSCDGKSCGPDGCGGVCGVCSESGKLICDQGKCSSTCTPKCDNKTCGSDGCGGTCGACKKGEYCSLGHCQSLSGDLSCVGHCGKTAPGGCGCNDTCIIGVDCCKDMVPACGCIPNCSGKVCGDDGCGGSCGSCKAGESCDNAGQCGNDPCKPDPCGGKGACQAGQCTCVSGFTGAKCDSCAPGYIGFPSCTPDLCLGNSCSGKGKCDAKTGKCTCDKDFTGQSCQVCSDGKKAFPDCDKPLPLCFGETCSNQGACNASTGKCECNTGFGGAKCNTCTDGKTWPQCGDGKCSLKCSGKGGCLSFTKCLCEPGFAGKLCEICEDSTNTWPNCGGAVNTNYAPDPAVTGVTCAFCGKDLGKLSSTPDATDKTPPTLKVLVPPSGGTIAPGMPIIAIIDDLVDPKTVTPSTFKVSPSGSDKVQVQGSVVAQVTTNKNTVLLFFPSNLNVGGKYKVLLDGIKDLGGNALAKVDSPFTLGKGSSGSFPATGSFETGTSGCFIAGDGGVLGVSDNMTPKDGKAMLGITTNNTATLGGTAGALGGLATVAYCGPITVPSGSKELLFDYNFASSEFDEYVGDKYDDVAIATISSSKGGVGGVVTSVNTVGKAGLPTKAFGLPNEGDPVAKMSGWKTATMTGISGLGSEIYVSFIVSDVADSAYTSALAVDHVRFK